MTLLPSFELEDCAAGPLVAGVDEAGRGPLAGPVVVAAVVLDRTRVPAGLNDSKKLSEAKRRHLFDEICSNASVSVVSQPRMVVDMLNIRGATLAGMRAAVSGLAMPLDLVLVDGRDCPPGVACPCQAIVKGDQRSQSIAAASIVAKVVRDQMMIAADAAFPGYGFAKHKGYGTAYHLAALNRLGPSPLHRLSFAPVRLEAEAKGLKTSE